MCFRAIITRYNIHIFKSIKIENLGTRCEESKAKMVHMFTNGRFPSGLLPESCTDNLETLNKTI